jgi:uncharacterized protein (TIGR00730 family)
MANICVFAGSTRRVKELFYETARTLGVYLAHEGHTLVYGGSDRGLMGAVALSTLSAGGKIIEIIPEIFQDVALRKGELIVTKDFRDRKQSMWERSDAFIALPGGFGTLAEIVDVMDTNLLANEQGKPIKPLVIMNTRGFYDHFLNHVEKIYHENFAPQDNREIYTAVESCNFAFYFIDRFTQPQLASKVDHIEAK